VPRRAVGLALGLRLLVLALTCTAAEVSREIDRVAAVRAAAAAARPRPPQQHSTLTEQPQGLSTSPHLCT